MSNLRQVPFREQRSAPNKNALSRGFETINNDVMTKLKSGKSPAQRNEGVLNLICVSCSPSRYVCALQYGTDTIYSAHSLHVSVQSSLVPTHLTSKHDITMESGEYMYATPLPSLRVLRDHTQQTSLRSHSKIPRWCACLRTQLSPSTRAKHTAATRKSCGAAHAWWESARRPHEAATARPQRPRPQRASRIRSPRHRPQHSQMIAPTISLPPLPSLLPLRLPWEGP